MPPVWSLALNVVKACNIKLPSCWQPFSIFIFSDKKRIPLLGGVRGRVWSIMAGANNLVVPVGTYDQTC